MFLVVYEKIYMQVVLNADDVGLTTFLRPNLTISF